MKKNNTIKILLATLTLGSFVSASPYDIATEKILKLYNQLLEHSSQKTAFERKKSLTEEHENRSGKKRKALLSELRSKAPAIVQEVIDLDNPDFNAIEQALKNFSDIEDAYLEKRKEAEKAFKDHPLMSIADTLLEKLVQPLYSAVTGNPFDPAQGTDHSKKLKRELQQTINSLGDLKKIFELRRSISNAANQEKLIQIANSLLGFPMTDADLDPILSSSGKKLTDLKGEKSFSDIEKLKNALTNKEPQLGQYIDHLLDNAQAYKAYVDLYGNHSNDLENVKKEYRKTMDELTSDYDNKINPKAPPKLPSL
jgi:hypothetical protein